MSLLSPKVELLDVREDGEPSIRDSAHIPFSELRERMQELPARVETVRVAATGNDASAAVQWLREHGRIAEEAPFEFQEGFRGRLWEPTAYLAQVVPKLSPGRALEVACGSGRDAAYLAGQGWEVDAVDHLDDAIDRARNLELRYLRGAFPIEWLIENVEADTWTPPRSYDLITVFRFLNRALLARIEDWLNPEGSLVVETFTIKNLERHEKPSNPKFLLDPGELPSFFSNLDIRDYSEGWRGDVHTARLWASRRRLP